MFVILIIIVIMIIVINIIFMAQFYLKWTYFFTLTTSAFLKFVLQGNIYWSSTNDAACSLFFAFGESLYFFLSFTKVFLMWHKET